MMMVVVVVACGQIHAMTNYTMALTHAKIFGGFDRGQPKVIMDPQKSDTWSLYLFFSRCALWQEIKAKTGENLMFKEL